MANTTQIRPADVERFKAASDAAIRAGQAASVAKRRGPRLVATVERPKPLPVPKLRRVDR